MKNSFDMSVLRRYFGEYPSCWYCEEGFGTTKHRADCFHHILGRVSDSPLNAAPLNNFECHLPFHSRLRNKDISSRFLKKTLSELQQNGYTLTDKDKLFMKKYSRYYED